MSLLRDWREFLEYRKAKKNYNQLQESWLAKYENHAPTEERTTHSNMITSEMLNPTDVQAITSLLDVYGPKQKSN